MNIQEITEGTETTTFNGILINLLKRKYPLGKFTDVGDGVETTKEEYGNGKDGLLVVAEPTTKQIGENIYVGMNIIVAYTGKYKGVLSSAIKETTEQMLRKHPGSQPALFLRTSDESNGAWDSIAKTLGYKLMSMEDITEGKVKALIGTDQEYPRTYTPQAVRPENNYNVFINGKVWKSFPTEAIAMRIANTIYNKNRRLRVDVKPK